MSAKFSLLAGSSAGLVILKEVADVHDDPFIRGAPHDDQDDDLDPGDGLLGSAHDESDDVPDPSDLAGFGHDESDDDEDPHARP